VSLDFTSQKGTVVIDLDKGRKVTDAKLLSFHTKFSGFGWKREKEKSFFQI
jgi:hypothetical protein